MPATRLFSTFAGAPSVVAARRFGAAASLAVGLLAGGCGTDGAESASGADPDAVDDKDQAVEITLDEYVVSGPSELDAGSVTFDIANDGSENHQLSIVATESYEALPRRENGSVELDKLEPTSLVVSTDPYFAGFPTDPLTVDLQPGTYLFFCNLQSFVGDKSHVGLGQRLVVTVN
jgi:hypothetical protein